MAESDLDIEKIKNYFKGEHSENDESYIDGIFCDNSKEKELKNFLSGQFEGLLKEDKNEDKNLDHVLHRIHFLLNTKGIQRKENKFYRFLTWSVRIAAIIILPVAIFWGIKGYRNFSSGNDALVEIKAPAWTRARFVLPDGTKGWLNSNSSLTYNLNFKSDRKVTLAGEAYFDVFHDKSKPFRVNADEIIIGVLGTHFNVASYENENNIEIVLEEGKVELTGKELKRSLTMKPNELTIFDKTRKDFSTELVETKKYMSWTEGKLIFRNDPLDVIARRLERWYNVEIEIRGNVISDPRLRATFIDENLEEVLELLKSSLPIEYEIENRNLLADDAYAKKKVIITIKPKIPNPDNS